MERTTDTIAAVATPAGPGAIGILRLSGPEAVSAASAAFRAADSRPLEAHPPRRLIYGDLLDREGAVIDKVLATYTRGPASYTGEDTAELHCHGAPMVLSLGLESLFSHGARQAGPGEFTRRAFLNGRLDLVQAEAVGDLLEASSREGARHAAGQLSGEVAYPVGQPHRCQHLIGIQRIAADLARQLHVLAGRQILHQVVELEDEADVVAAVLGELLAVERAHTRAIQHDGARGGRVHAAEHVQKRRLASPGRPHDDHEFALLNSEAHVAHGGHFHLAHLVDLAHVGKFHEGHDSSQHPAPRPGAFFSALTIHDE